MFPLTSHLVYILYMKTAMLHARTHATHKYTTYVHVTESFYSNLTNNSYFVKIHKFLSINVTN